MDRKNPFSCFDRAYFVRVLTVVAVLFALVLAGKAFEKGTAARLGLGGLQAAAMGYLIALTVLSVRRLDELQQRIHLEAIAISFAATGIVVSAIDLLESGGMPAPHTGTWIWIFMVIVWGGAVLLRRHHYR
jgi:hypothetical protein